MSVTIFPYIDKEKTDAYLSVAASSAPAQSADAAKTFQDFLETADRSQQAMAVDALLNASHSGTISIETVQELLGFNPYPNAPVYAAATNGNSTADTAAANSTENTSANNTGNTSSSGNLGCPDNLKSYFEEAARTYNVDINLLMAIAKAESNFNPSATSSAGAMGVMQLMPSTASGLGINDAYNARDNIMGGAQVISQNLERYDGNLSLALAGYNAGCGNVDKYGGIPPFEETQNYVKKVLDYYEKVLGNT